MTSMMRRVFVALRASLGLNDPADDRLHATHGWLLPPVPSRPEPIPARDAAGGNDPRR